MCGDHTEAVAVGTLHDPPGLDGCFPTRSELLESLPLGLNTVGLDIQMDAAGVVHPLERELQPPGPAGKRHIGTCRLVVSRAVTPSACCQKRTPAFIVMVWLLYASGFSQPIGFPVELSLMLYNPAAAIL